MSDRSIRVVALGIPRRERADGTREILVSECHDPDPGVGEPETFYRPLGGGVVFGEHSEDALVREFAEELSVTVSDVERVGTYEDVFTHEGATHHEVWRVYEPTVEEDWVYERDRFVGYEPDLDERIDCRWIPTSTFTGGEKTFYPEDALADLW